MPVDFKRIVPDRTLDTFEERIAHAVAILYTHGFLTMGERDKVIKRIQKEQSND